MKLEIDTVRQFDVNFATFSTVDAEVNRGVEGTDLDNTDVTSMGIVVSNKNAVKLWLYLPYVYFSIFRLLQTLGHIWISSSFNDCRDKREQYL